MDDLKIKKVTRLLRKEKVETDYCSPCYVAEFAYNKNIKLTSDEVVYISDHYELEEK